MKRLILQVTILIFLQPSFAQNVGIGTLVPQAKTHIKGSSDISQLVIDAAASQTNVHPLIRLRNSNGTDLLWIHTDDTSNLFIGRNAGIKNNADPSTLVGIYNVFIGQQAGSFNTIGDQNTALGYGSLKANSTGYANTGAGYLSLSKNVAGSENTAVGLEAMLSNTSGSKNTAVGLTSLRLNTSANDNTAVGHSAAYNTTTGNKNTAVGSAALYTNSSGSSNVAIGFLAMDYSYSNSFNTAVGAGALLKNYGQYNTGLGYEAGKNFWIGWNNTIIGAQADVAFDEQYNAIAIGNLAIANDNSKVRIGNASNWSYEAFANWTNVSDGLYKKNIQETVSGLNFILRLRPVNYQVDVEGLRKKFGEDKAPGKDGRMQKAIDEKAQMIWTGFIAQEVEAAAKESNFNFSGVDKPRNQFGVYGLRYAEFVVPLVKAVQEQQTIIEELKNKNAALEARIEKLERMRVN